MVVMRLAATCPTVCISAGKLTSSSLVTSGYEVAQVVRGQGIERYAIR